MRFVRVIIIIFSCILMLSCLSDNRQQRTKPLIIATTGMIADIVKNIGGEFVTVESLIAPGIDPHSYKASERDVIKIAGANIIFHNGLYLEGKLSEVLEKAKNTVPSYAVSEYIPEDRLIYLEGEVWDPHIWFDPALWAFAVQRVTDSLVEIDPENEIYFRKNEDHYIRLLTELDESIRQRLSEVPEESRILVTSHNAFSYFGKAYEWDVIGIQGVNTVSETSVYNIQSLAKTVADRGIKCVFTETSVSTRSVDALTASAAALGVQLSNGKSLFSDSLGPEDSGAGTYIDMLNYNTDAIISGVLNR